MVTTFLAVTTDAAGSSFLFLSSAAVDAVVTAVAAAEIAVDADAAMITDVAAAADNF